MSKYTKLCVQHNRRGHTGTMPETTPKSADICDVC